MGSRIVGNVSNAPNLQVEVDGDWVNALVSLPGTGGTISESGGYRYHTFTTVGTNTFTPLGPRIVEYCIVAGGGGGGGSNDFAGGNGGTGVVIVRVRT